MPLKANIITSMLVTLVILDVLAFTQRKNITTGEGGMVICNRQIIFIINLELLGFMDYQRMLGKDICLKVSKILQSIQHYDVSEIGFKYNMIDINAAMGIVQLNKIQNSLEK